MARITIPIEKLPPRLKRRQWPSIPSMLIVVGAGLVLLAYLGH